MRLPTAALLILSSLATGQERHPLRTGWEVAAAAPDGGRPAEEAYRPAAVPAPFEDVLGTDFDGVAWYRRTLTLRPSWEGRTLSLDFLGAATEATVFCDGEEVGGHLGAWTPFRVPVPEDAVRDGAVRLEVRLDEKVGHNTQGFLPVIQPHFGGLWQDVVLCVDSGPVLDRHGLLTFGEGDGTLRVQAAVLERPGARAGQVRVRVTDGARAVARTTVDPAAAAAGLELRVPDVRPWSPGAPHLYGCEVTLLDGRGRVLDRVRRRVGFRSLEADGTTVRWNGAPLQVRGMLHWGYVPPLLAPNPDPSVWRRQLETFKALGCNLVKACLWVPPESFFAIADEVGILVWEEYPTWHPTMTPGHREALLREYAEFHRRDRSHPSAAFRSLTCETGHGADLEVIRALYDQAHAMVPDTLVVDDSSWISWQRVHDFYDDHPYGNNDGWPGKLAGFRRFVAEHGAKPLLFGECITFDTWIDLEAWRRVHGDAEPWWAPLCLEDQAGFEAWVREAFGPEVLDSLLPVSEAYALRNRKYQIERLRLDISDAGYVMAVHRDFTKARMGFYDDLDRLKWSPGEWAWHGDTMLCLDTEDDRRAFLGEAAVAVRLSHFGATPFRGTVNLAVDEPGRAAEPVELELAPGTVSEAVRWTPGLPAGDAPRRFRVRAWTEGSHEVANHWDLWLLPREEPAAVRGLREVDHLDLETLGFLRQGGRVLLRAGDAEGSLRTTSLWYLRGAPFAPPHPVHERVPAEMLLELQTFDLEGPRLMLWDHLVGHVDPILAYWETHDLPEVRRRLFAFDCRVGKGRLLATTLDHETPAGRWVLDRLREHLAHGPAPERGLPASTLADLERLMVAEELPLEDWHLRTDPGDVGVAEAWQDTTAPGEGWRAIRAGAHWEGQGLEHYDGVAWYHVAADVPASWRGETVHAVFEGVDDSYHLFVNGEQVARFGDPETGETVWLERTTADVSDALRYGSTNHIVLRVVDHVGAGGLWKPAFLTTGPVNDTSKLLH